MPLIIRIEEARPGQVLAEDVLNPIGQPLVRRGVKLNPRIIRSLKQKGAIEFLRVILPGEDPFEQFWRELEDGGLPSAVVETAREELERAFDKVLRNTEAVESHIRVMMEFVVPVIRSLFDGTSPLFDRLQLLARHDNWLYQHSWSSMLLSLSLLRGAWDRGMLFPDEQTKVDVGLGSILRDLGMAEIPGAVVMKAGKLTPEERALIESHPQRSYDLVRDVNHLMPLAKAIVAHHHQLLDGSGYGAGDRSPLKGDDIPDLVRLVTVADVYDALVSERPYRPTNLPFQAIRILQSHAGTKFDGRFVHVLSKTVVDYPVGSLLLFPRGLLGCVMQNYPREKQNPKVLILASFCRQTAHFLARTYRLEAPPVFFMGGSYILTGAATPSSLAKKLKLLMTNRSLEDLVAPRRERSLTALDEWYEVFEKDFGFVLE